MHHIGPRSKDLMKPIQFLKFYEEWHKYRLENEWLQRSVTQVLGTSLSDEAKANIMRYKDGPDGWAARGEALHGVVESFLNGQELVYAERWTDWVDPLIECDLFKDCEVIATEYRLCDKRKSLGGSFDFLIKRSNGEIVLGDVKTVSSQSAARRRKPAKEQLGAYAAMLCDHHPALPIDKCVTVISAPNECKVIEQKVDECLESWVDSWDIYQFMLEDW